MAEMSWFKHMRGMVTDDKFEEYFERFGVEAFAIIYMFSLILERATKDGGYFRKGKDIPHDDMSLRAVFRRVKEFHSSELIEKAIQLFIEDGVLEDKGESMYFVKNWEKYQSQSLSTPRVKMHRNKAKIDEVMTLFNKLTGKTYKHSTSSYREKINARIEDGYTMRDFEKVITWKLKDWGKDAKMKKHITPDTLFRPGHFDRYLNEVPSNLKKAEPASELFEVEDVFGTRKMMTQKELDKAEAGFYTKV
jgi:uncharacterized phage protein (TIGR02220 family)